MNLILWRHAEAEDLSEALRQSRPRDMKRELTKRGERQAEMGAQWLKKHAPRNLNVLVSPAARTVATARAYSEQFDRLPELALDTDVGAVLAAINWPHGSDTLVVGHQPWMGRLISLLLAGTEINWSIRKGGIWWLCQRTRENQPQIVLRGVINPEMF